jgi:hypothetical protein
MKVIYMDSTMVLMQRSGMALNLIQELIKIGTVKSLDGMAPYLVIVK